MPNLRRLHTKFYAAAPLILFTALSACSPPKIVSDTAVFETTVPRPDEPPIAKVGGTFIYGSDVSRQAEAQNLIAVGEMLPRTDPRFDTALQELIDQRLLAMESLNQDLHSIGGVERRLSLARERILSSVALEEHLAKTVTDKTLRAAYAKQVELGRNTANFEQSREQIKALLTAEQVQLYLVSLRQKGDIQILKTKDTDTLETDDE